MDAHRLPPPVSEKLSSLGNQAKIWVDEHPEVLDRIFLNPTTPEAVATNLADLFQLGGQTSALLEIVHLYRQIRSDEVQELFGALKLSLPTTHELYLVRLWVRDFADLLGPLANRRGPTVPESVHEAFIQEVIELLEDAGHIASAALKLVDELADAPVAWTTADDGLDSQFFGHAGWLFGEQGADGHQRALETLTDALSMARQWPGEPVASIDPAEAEAAKNIIEPMIRELSGLLKRLGLFEPSDTASPEAVDPLMEQLRRVNSQLPLSDPLRQLFQALEKRLEKADPAAAAGMVIRAARRMDAALDTRHAHLIERLRQGS
jgi:hypothetical protein